MKRCMIIDDSNVIRKVARRILANPDMMVIEAASGEQALDMCATEMPDLIIVDDVLPDMPATEFINRVRQISDGKSRPRIVVSLVELDIGTLMRSKRAGATGYIMKPFNRPLLIERLRLLQAA